jgi:hypothetical protein
VPEFNSGTVTKWKAGIQFWHRHKMESRNSILRVLVIASDSEAIPFVYQFVNGKKLTKEIYNGTGIKRILENNRLDTLNKLREKGINPFF